MTWRVYLFSSLIAGATAAVTAFITVKLILPDGPTANPQLAPPPPQTQILYGADQLEFPKGDLPSEKEIFYKIPFASPPHLTLTYGNQAGYFFADQTASSFKLRRILPVKDKEQDWRIIGCNWQAEGLPASR